MMIISAMVDFVKGSNGSIGALQKCNFFWNIIDGRDWEQVNDISKVKYSRMRLNLSIPNMLTYSIPFVALSAHLTAVSDLAVKLL